MSAPVRGLASIAMSGTPRLPGGIGVLLAGRTLWYAGREKTSLKPPPVAIPRASSSHTISAWPAAPAAWHAAGGETLSTTLAEVLFGSVQSAVPPTPVTSGSEAGHSTVCPSRDEPPLPTGDLRSFRVPVSPDAPRTVTPFAAAASNP